MKILAMGWINYINNLIQDKQCSHHWIIETPNGPISMGICKLCGAKKEFMNSPEIYFWPKEKGYGKNKNKSTRA